MSFGAGVLLFTACDRSRTTDTTDPTNTTDTTAGTTNSTINNSSTTASGGMDEADQDAMYRDRAIKTTEKMTTDLELDTLSQALAEEIYYNRAKRRAEAQQEYADNTFRLNQEMNTIEEETDQQVLGILSHSQSQEYVENRENYADLDSVALNRTDTVSAGGLGTETNSDTKNQSPDTGTGQNKGDETKAGTQESPSPGK